MSSGSGRRLWCPSAAGIHGLASAVNDVIVEGVLVHTAAVRRCRRAARVGFVFGEQQFRAGRRMTVRRYRPSVSLFQLDRVGRRPARIAEARLRRRPRSRCCGTKASAAGGASPVSGPRLSTVMRISMSSASPWRIRRRRRNSDRRRRRRCRAVRTPARSRRGAVLLDQAARRETRPADTCTGTSCRSASAWSRDSSSTP